MWNLALLIAFILLLWYCCIKAYFSNRKDRYEEDENEDQIINDAHITEGIFYEMEDMEIGETRVKVIHKKKAS